MFIVNISSYNRGETFVLYIEIIELMRIKEVYHSKLTNPSSPLL
ncbi:hypothetical protein HanLR1_Chr13g0485021 [Helianthus annuus]|nr:hypothetical protein HanLR1_Chr13g0485021 [Helianthus annuus]